jgi:hypothetical protein
LDVIDLTTPSGEVIEISSSCDLSIFSLKVDPQCVEGGGGVPEGSLSASIGELWPDIEKLDEIGLSIESLPEGSLRGRGSLPSAR